MSCDEKIFKQKKKQTDVRINRQNLAPTTTWLYLVLARRSQERLIMYSILTHSSNFILFFPIYYETYKMHSSKPQNSSFFILISLFVMIEYSAKMIHIFYIKFIEFEQPHLQILIIPRILPKVGNFMQFLSFGDLYSSLRGYMRTSLLG